MVERELGGDRGAARVANDVHRGQAEVIDERDRVGDVSPMGGRLRRRRAADPASPVVADQLVPIGEDRLSYARHEAIGEHVMLPCYGRWAST